MPPPSRRNFGGRKAHQQHRRSGSKAQSTGPKGSKRNRSSKSHQRKQKTRITVPSSSNNTAQLAPPTILPPSVPVPAEESTWEAKVGEIQDLHARWKAENMIHLEGDELISRYRQRCKDVGLIIFGFTLQEAQVDALYTLFYEQRDLLLLAKTGFGKSLIFQLLPFIYDPTGVVIILMPLKLLQAEQNNMINRIATGKAIALTGENNQKVLPVRTTPMSSPAQRSPYLKNSRQTF